MPEHAHCSTLSFSLSLLFALQVSMFVACLAFVDQTWMHGNNALNNICTNTLYICVHGQRSVKSFNIDGYVLILFVVTHGCRNVQRVKRGGERVLCVQWKSGHQPSFIIEFRSRMWLIYFKHSIEIRFKLSELLIYGLKTIRKDIRCSLAWLGLAWFCSAWWYKVKFA